MAAAVDRRHVVGDFQVTPDVKIVELVVDNVVLSWYVLPVARARIRRRHRDRSQGRHAAAVTVDPDPVIPSNVAEIVTGPPDSPVASPPLLLIVAHVVGVSTTSRSHPTSRSPERRLVDNRSPRRCELFGVTSRKAHVRWRHRDRHTSVAGERHCYPVRSTRIVDPGVNVAEIVTGPGLTAVANPLLLIAARRQSELQRRPCDW